MQFLSAFFALAAIVSSTLATPIEIVERATVVPPKNKVYIQGVNYAGTGCPPGSVAVSMGDDLSNVNLAFSKYSAQIGPTIQPNDWRRNCLINFNVKFPQGYAYTIFSTDYRGYVQLETNITALQKSEYWFTGVPQVVAWKSEWIGPIDDDYYFQDNVAAKSKIYSPCGFKSTLNVNTQVRLDNKLNKKGSGVIATDAIGHHVDTKYHHKYHIKWKKC